MNALRHRLFVLLVSLLGCLLTVSVVAAESAPRTWVRTGSNADHSAVLTLHQRTADQATLSLEVISRSGSTTARTGTLDKVFVPIVNGVALYREAGTSPEACSIVFDFAASAVQVTQFGDCELFGVGVNSSGRYVSRARPR
ncbi:hypothetical protein [Viridibacterium curvum]